MPATVFLARARELRVPIEKPEPKFRGSVLIGETDGRFAEFKDGRFETDDPQVIEVLRERIAAPDGPEGLVEIEKASLAPDASDVLVRLVTANAQETRDILEAERVEWERPAVIEACEAKLAQFSTRGPRKPE